MNQNTKNWLVAAGLIAGGVILWKISSGKKVSTAVKETITEPVEIIKSVSKKLVKGSPEAKERMAKLRSMPRKHKTEIKKESAEHPELPKETVEQIVEDHEKKKVEIPIILKKSKAGKKGGNETAKLGKHKGHKSKRGLAQDQKESSNEVHEKHYRKSKRGK